MVGYYLLPDDDPTRSALYGIDILFSLVFLADSVYLLVRAPDKKAYLRWGWLDFLGSVPFFVALRVCRVARLARRAFQEFQTGAARVQGESSRRHTPPHHVLYLHHGPQHRQPARPAL
jgi:hypothetical protein